MRLVPADLPQRVARFLNLYSMLNGDLRMGVAVSGGADSVVLLHLLNHLAKAAGAHLVIAHVNHQLRALESDTDETFVRALAAKLGWPIEVLQGPPAAGNLEAEARRIRLEFFRHLRSSQGLHLIATGHTASDQAETILFRLFRGTGLEGLGGIAPLTPTGLLRPLLGVTREEVRNFAQENGIDWRSDTSNNDLRFRRNRIRLQLLPFLARHFNPHITGTLASASKVARDESDFWAQHVKQLLPRITHASPRTGIFLDVLKLAQEHTAVQRRLVREAIALVRGHLRGIDIQHVEAVIQLTDNVQSHNRVQIPGVDALRSFHVLRLAKLEDAIEPRGFSFIPEPYVPIVLPYAAGEVSVNRVTANARNYATVKDETLFLCEESELDEAALDSVGGWPALRVRNWEPGDSILLSSSGTPVKLKKLFQENRIFLWERRHWPVLVAGGQILWTRHFGVAALFAASQMSRDRVLVRFRSGERRLKDL